MRRSPKAVDAAFTLGRKSLLQALLAVALLFISFVLLFELPVLSRPIPSSAHPSVGIIGSDLASLPLNLGTEGRAARFRPTRLPLRHDGSADESAVLPLPAERRRMMFVSGLDFQLLNATFSHGPFSGLDKAARDAWEVGRKLLDELKSVPSAGPGTEKDENRTEENCPHSIILSGDEFLKQGKLVVLPCGLTLGSHLTVVAKPYEAHPEKDPKISILNEGDKEIMVSQFMMELQGLKTVDGEDPPRILHFNPRLKGDWSGKPVIEQNTCYRMQWGSAQRCEGWMSASEDETVDGLVKCEKWIRDDDDHMEESRTTWWLNRLISRPKRISMDWPYPFIEQQLFVLTLSAGLEGYHVTVDGRHVTSFPYRIGFVLEDATGLSVNGDLHVHSIFAGSLPTSHPSFAPQKSLEMSEEWQAPPLPEGPVDLFIGILSAGNHFAERMAVRKSWMNSVTKSPNMVARFFVALHGRKEMNVELKKEAEFFGDIVIVPFLDSYDLVVLKTVAICEYGVHTVSARYVMKCDDDTFIRVDAVLNKVTKVASNRSLYVGNMNYHHKPLREGKWAVTYEEITIEDGEYAVGLTYMLPIKGWFYNNLGQWIINKACQHGTTGTQFLSKEWPEEDYPPYANGPGYIVSSDIAQFIISDFHKHKLRLFKMEDVSMGMWVEQFNKSETVEYVHSVKFCQFGCIDGYYTAHYQSPRQMTCMWDKLLAGKPQCCNMR